MSTTSGSLPSSRLPALGTFLHGVEPRAWVFALNQCGDMPRAQEILESAMGDFLRQAQSLPLTQWPLQFWNGLLGHPLMLVELQADALLAPLGPGQRAALLLRLVVGLDFVHAAHALDVSPEAYEIVLRQALTHPDMNDARMQSIRETLHGQIHQLPLAQRQLLAALRETALSTLPAQPAAVVQPRAPYRQPRRWLWGVMLVSMLIGISWYFWPAVVPVAPRQSEILPPEVIAPPPALSDTVAVTHPDYQQLAEPADEALARQLAFLSWFAATITPTTGSQPAPIPEPAQEDLALDALPPAERTLLASARDAWPTLEPQIRAALSGHARDWQTRTLPERALIKQRMQAWNQLSATERARRRNPFTAWQRLDAAQRQRVRIGAGDLGLLTAPEQQALLGRFAALPADTQSLWSLGPALGQELAPIAALFAFMPERERPELLAALGTLDAPTRADLALLAPRLNEAQRQSLRKELLATPPAQRAAMIAQRLNQ